MGATLDKIDAVVKDFADVDVAINQTARKLRATIDRVPQQVKADWDAIGSDLDKIRTRTQSRSRALRDELAARTSSMKRRVEGESPRLSAAAKAETIPLVTRIDAAMRSIESGAGGVVKRVDDAAREIRATAEGATRSVQQAARRVGDELGGAVQAPLDRIHAVRTRLEDEKTTRRAELRRIADAFRAEIASADKRLVAPLTQVRENVAVTHERMKVSVDGVKDALVPPLDAAEDAVRQAEQVLLAPIVQMRTTLAAIDAQLRAAADTVLDGIDRTINEGLSSLQRLVAQVRTILDAAIEVLTGIEQVMSRFRQGVLPPIEALDQLVQDLDALFRQAIQALRALLTQGTAVLEAIPARGLPKMLVDPTITAIQSGMDAALAPISTAATTAGDQLESLASSLASQVDTVKTQALTQVDAFVAATLVQLDAVLPPVKAQLEMIRTQMDAMVTQSVMQIDAAKTAIVATIDETKAQMKAQVDVVSTQVTTQIDTARTQVGAMLDPVPVAIDDARARLDAQVDAAVTALSRPVDEAAKALQNVVDQISQRIAEADENMVRMTEQMLAPFRAELANLKTLGSELETTIGAKLDELRKQNHEAIAKVRATLPGDADVDARLAPIRARADQELDTIEADLARLMA